MPPASRAARVVFVVIALSTGAALAAQDTPTFRARLSTVPIDLSMQSTVAGSGSVTATLAGRTLSVTGTFRGLKSPATVVRLHIAPKGLRGPAVHDLTASTGTDGTITGSVDLTAEQVKDLKASRVYIQLLSDKAPEGNLWGWLLPEDARR